jgi:transcriptional regulator NrdR family protein
MLRAEFRSHNLKHLGEQTHIAAAQISEQLKDLTLTNLKSQSVGCSVLKMVSFIDDQIAILRDDPIASGDIGQ